MTHASLFSGIGGFDLPAEWVGWENIFHCEWNEFGQKVLKYYWPNAKSYGDITKTDFTIWRGRIDVLTGGFPCQPYSLAGKRLGKEDERHLWPEMLRAIREIQPRWVVGENVSGIISWNGGLVFEEVQADLEAEGYEVQAFVLPACAVNAPHRRDRVWFVAHSNDTGRGTRLGKIQKEDGEISQRYNDAEFSNTGNWNAPNSTGVRFWLNCSEKQSQFKTPGARYGMGRKSGFATNSNGGEYSNRMREREQEDREETKAGMDNRLTRLGYDGTRVWECFPTQPPICGGNDGLPRKLDGITFSKWRNESIKAYGNAIVPQVAAQIFKAINEYENSGLK